MGIPHAALLLLLSNHEPLRWVHGWGPIAGLRARTQERSPVALVVVAGAGSLLNGVYAYSLPLSSRAWNRCFYLFIARLGSAAYTVGGGRWAANQLPF